MSETFLVGDVDDVGKVFNIINYFPCCVSFFLTDMLRSHTVRYLFFLLQKLVRVGRECLDVGISVCGPGITFDAIGNAIEYVLCTCD